jgi:hypothetical protein
VRVIISNVLAPKNSADLSPCPVQVTFVGADGSLMGDATMVQLKPAESTSVPTSVPASLVRAIVSIGNVPDSPKLWAFRTGLEVFDAQTGTTFISIAGESNVGNGECSAPARVLGASKSAWPREYGTGAGTEKDKPQFCSYRLPTPGPCCAVENWPICSGPYPSKRLKVIRLDLPIFGSCQRLKKAVVVATPVRFDTNGHWLHIGNLEASGSSRGRLNRAAD